VAPGADHLRPESLQAGQVARDGVVIEIAPHHPIQPTPHLRHRFMPAALESLAQRGERGPHALLDRQPQNRERAAPRRVRAQQWVKPRKSNVSGLLSIKLSLVIVLLTLTGCAQIPVAVDCPSPPPVPKALMQPPADRWLLPPTPGLSEPAPRTP